MSEPFNHPNALKIFGPAGSGKTRELVRLLHEHESDGDFGLSDGIIVSFTKAAAGDIARRARPDKEPGRYHCTLHALCKRYFFFEGEMAEKRLKEFFAVRRINYAPSMHGDPEEWAPTEDARASEGAQIVSLWSLARSRMIPIESAKRLRQPTDELHYWYVGSRLQDLFDQYDGWKHDEGIYDFTDMLEYAVENPPRARWAFFVLDEAQDCSPLQWAVVQQFASKCDVVYIAGDDDQAIYSWAGASPAEFLNADTAAEDVLHTNYRSGEVIVSAAQGLIRRNQLRREKDIVADRRGGVLTHSWEPELGIKESTFAMARAHYLLTPLMQRLTDDHFPFIDKRGKFGVTGTAATQMSRYRRLAAGQTITLEELRLLFTSIPSNGPWLLRGSKARIGRVEKDQRQTTDVRLPDLGLYGATEELVNAMKGGVTDPLKLDAERMAYLDGITKRWGPEFLDQHRASEVLQVGPVHAFKGLEADHVILHEGMPPAATREAEVDPEPERRVIYVALTRAKERVTHLPGRAHDQWERLL